ncbi:ABC transporter substrate-binding protein [Nitrococcus mobilis]|uniref:Oligopeptide ABC transporter periplasmic component n=1 Tax=Nitrococcus mobilis Nb-231 TaxID=314278 RepID=A4BMD9_9GAMM|nr:ABC transporter substrate-binding protein [Nitrococcus mobilis]EAR23477.1 oligopeptide ABC transporter periplasmic component [Nitrococcus mobilis Nb-231]
MLNAAMRGLYAAMLVFVLVGCGDSTPWNDPYPASQTGANILYSAFQEQPKHLDPARSYNVNEALFIAQIYEPPLQYHYLKRPYRLVPLAATEVPEPRYLDAEFRELPASAPARGIAYSVYDIHIRSDIRYQPHPAFARNAEGAYRYHALSRADLEGIHELSDFRHTGSRLLTTADFVYQIKRLAHPGLNSPIFGLMSEYILGLDQYAKRLRPIYDELKREQGTSAFLDLREYPLEGAQVVDRTTYRITIKGKYPQFRYWLAMAFFAAVPWEADRFYSQPGMAERNLTLDWYPVGSGPFMLTQNNPNLRMVLTRNPNFHGERYPHAGVPADARAGLLADAGRPLPFVDKVIFSLEKESIPYWSKFLQGYYDASGVSSDSFDQAIQFSGQGSPEVTPVMRRKGIELETAVTTSIYYMGFNMLDEVVGGRSERARKLRRAISIAVDYEEYISIFANGRGMPAQGPIPPGIFGHRKGQAGINRYVYDWVDGQPRRKPIAEARRLMAQAGYPGGRDANTGEPLVLYFDTAAAGPDSKSRLDWFRKQFAKLGIQLVVRATDYNRFQDKMLKGTEQLFEWGWVADYPDPENFLFLLYGPNKKVNGNGENAANYSNPEFDRLFRRTKNMDNNAERRRLTARMVDIVQRDAPWIWGFHPELFVLHHVWYHNLKPNTMANNTVKYIRIDPALRAEQRRAWNQPVIWPLIVVAALVLASLVPGVVAYRRRERAAAL